MPKIVDHDEKRASLIDKLAPMILNGAVNEMSLRTISKRIGISLGALSHYFKTKDELREAVFKFYSGRTLELLARELESEASIKGRVLKCFQVIVKNEDQCLTEALLLVDQARQRSSYERESRSKHHRVEEVYLDRLMELFGFHRAQSRFLLTYIVGFLIRRQWTGRKEDLSVQTDFLIRALRIST